MALGARHAVRQSLLLFACCALKKVRQSAFLLRGFARPTLVPTGGYAVRRFVVADGRRRRLEEIDIYLVALIILFHYARTSIRLRGKYLTGRRIWLTRFRKHFL